MWDTVEIRTGRAGDLEHLSHDLPCPYCGHAPHRFLQCDHDCGCEPADR